MAKGVTFFFLLLANCFGLRTGSADSLAQFRTEEITYSNGTTTLGALFVLPDGDGPFPAAVIVHGSGPSDRTNQWSRSITQLFVNRGVAVLLTDKRGSGVSGGDWRTGSFEDLATDAIAGIELLRKRKDVDETRIATFMVRVPLQ